LAILSDATNGGYMARNPEIPNGGHRRRRKAIRQILDDWVPIPGNSHRVADLNIPLVSKQVIKTPTPCGEPA
jgi:hypothetical protein